MIKIQELHGPSCLTAAADDEPLFVLRANDELAPQLVREWAESYYDMKKDFSFHLTPQQHAKYTAALKLAIAMENWYRAKHLVKVHDTPGYSSPPSLRGLRQRD